MAPPASKAPAAVHLAIIRLAMLVGVLLFGGIIWFLRRQGSVAPLDADAAAGARLIAVVWLVGSIGGLVAMLALTSRDLTEARRRMVSILAWALGEGASLGGHPIEPWTEIPRMLGPDGRQRLDVFGFQLQRAEDLAHFARCRDRAI